jgi:SAM-dependent methyltransferase
VSTALPELIRSHGLQISELAQANFFNYQPKRQFDLVCSFGFIEHFPNYQEAIRRHVDLVKPGGMLIISCPNFRWFQKAYHRLFDATNLRRHVLPAMNFGAWRATLTQCGMEIVHQSYYGTCEVWREKNGKRRPIKDRVADRLIRLSRRLDARVSYPNQYTSPYMIMFARKPAVNSPEGANETGRG